MRRGTVQVKKSAADDLRVCSEKSPNIAFERDAANSAAPLNLDVGRVTQTVLKERPVVPMLAGVYEHPQSLVLPGHTTLRCCSWLRVKDSVRSIPEGSYPN
jgi:hypothetical protein